MGVNWEDSTCGENEYRRNTVGLRWCAPARRHEKWEIREPWTHVAAGRPAAVGDAAPYADCDAERVCDATDGAGAGSNAGQKKSGDTQSKTARTVVIAIRRDACDRRVLQNHGEGNCRVVVGTWNGSPAAKGLSAMFLKNHRQQPSTAGHSSQQKWPNRPCEREIGVRVGRKKTTGQQARELTTARTENESAISVTKFRPEI